MRQNRLPDYVNAAMREYTISQGELGLPRCFVEHHKALAEMELLHREQLSDRWVEEHGEAAYFKVIEKTFVNDGWCDGFWAVQAVVAVRESTGDDWTLKTIKWHDSFAWFEQSSSGAWLRWVEALSSTIEHSPTMKGA